MFGFPPLSFPPPAASFPPRARGPRSRGVAVPAQADLVAVGIPPAGWSRSRAFRFPRPLLRFPRESGGPGAAVFQRLPRRTSAQRSFSQQDVRVHVPFVPPAKAEAQEPRCFSACPCGPQRSGLSVGRIDRKSTRLNSSL